MSDPEAAVLRRVAGHLADVQRLLLDADTRARENPGHPDLLERLNELALLAGEAASAFGGPRAELEPALDAVDRALAGTGVREPAAYDAATDLLDAARRALAAPGPTATDAEQLLGRLATLPSIRVRDVVDHLAEADLALLFGLLDPRADATLHHRLARTLPPELYRRLADTDPHEYWNPPTPGGPAAWAVPAGLGVGERPPDALRHLTQDPQLGTCAALACLGAVEAAAPGTLAQRFVPHPNGTCAVTLFRAGSAFEVVVTPELPVRLDHLGRPTRQVWPRDDADIFELFEKALAMVWGALDPEGDGVPGFAGMSGVPADKVHRVLEIITGRPAQRIVTHELTRERLVDAVRSGRPVTVTSLWGQAAADHRLYQPGRLLNRMHPEHEYYVLGVTDRAEPVIALGNPWGLNQAGTGTVELTWSEFCTATYDVTIGG